MKFPPLGGNAENDNICWMFYFALKRKQSSRYINLIDTKNGRHNYICREKPLPLQIYLTNSSVS